MATGNEYKKVRSLLAKTVKAGCTEGEAVSALETALKLIEKFGLDVARLDIVVPDGYRIDGKTVTKVAPAADTAKAAAGKPAKPAKDGLPREGSKERRLIDLMNRKEGVTNEQIQKEFGILPHTARAMISTGKKKGHFVPVLDRATGVYRNGQPKA
jgi:hypothetical protein